MSGKKPEFFNKLLGRFSTNPKHAVSDTTSSVCWNGPTMKAVCLMQALHRAYAWEHGEPLPAA
jgi:hypothetical protein